MLFMILDQMSWQNSCIWSVDECVDLKTQWADILFKIY